MAAFIRVEKKKTGFSENLGFYSNKCWLMRPFKKRAFEYPLLDRKGNYCPFFAETIRSYLNRFGHFVGKIIKEIIVMITKNNKKISK